jgi:hypothetical protein
MSIIGSLEVRRELTTDLINMAEPAFHVAGDVRMLSLLAFCQYDKQFSSPYLAERCTLVNSPRISRL